MSKIFKKKPLKKIGQTVVVRPKLEDSLNNLYNDMKALKSVYKEEINQAKEMNKQLFDLAYRLQNKPSFFKRLKSRIKSWLPKF